MHYLKYFYYVLRHKWFVFIASINLGVPIWIAIIHDWSKYLPSEFKPYADHFFLDQEVKNDEQWREAGLVGNIHEAIPFGRLEVDRFKVAVNHHYHRNKHHWQYWLSMDIGASVSPYSYPIPEIYIREMLADWVGAGRAINGSGDPRMWYRDNRDKIVMRDRSKAFLESLIVEKFGKIEDVW